MPAPLTFRPGLLDDRIGLMALQWRAALGNPRDREMLASQSTASGIVADSLGPGRCVVAAMNSTDVGFVTVVRRDDGDALLDGLFVDPGYWTLGVGRALFGEARKLARAMGAGAIYVNAGPQSLDFCRSLGFGPTGDPDLMMLPV